MSHASAILSPNDPIVVRVEVFSFHDTRGETSLIRVPMRMIRIVSKDIKIILKGCIAGRRVATTGICGKLLEVTGADKMIVDVTGGREN